MFWFLLIYLILYYFIKWICFINDYTLVETDLLNPYQRDTSQYSYSGFVLSGQSSLICAKSKNRVNWKNDGF